MRPRLLIDTGAIEQNSALVAGLLEVHDVKLTGVTKACLGEPRVARAMLAGGASALADSRSENIDQLRDELSHEELQLMRPIADIGVRPSADLFFVSSAYQARRLLGLGSDVPAGVLSDGRGVNGGPDVVRLVLMVETGDGREGVPPTMAGDEARRLAALPGACLTGLATNFACSRPEAPPAAALAGLAQASATVRDSLGSDECLRISAGGSGLLRLWHCSRGEKKPAVDLAGVDELRCGEALLLGSIPGVPASALEKNDGPFAGFRQDAFTLEAPVLESYEKDGAEQVLVGIGSQDIGTSAGEAVNLIHPGLKPLYATSDYLALRQDPGTVTQAKVGDIISFRLGYYGLVAAMTSPFVRKAYL